MSQNKRKIKHPQPETKKSNINGNDIDREIKSDLEKKIYFSFEFLELNDDDFNITQCNFENIFTRKKELSKMKLKDLIRNASKLRFHEIDFDRTSRRSGFINCNTDGKPWQFAYDGKGRIHGKLDTQKGIFYIVWFDPKHKLFPHK